MDIEDLVNELNGWKGQTVQVTHSAKHGYEVAHSSDFIMPHARFVGTIFVDGEWTEEDLEGWLEAND